MFADVDQRRCLAILISGDLLPENAKTLGSINETIVALANRRRSEINVTGYRARSKIAWKLETFVEAVLA
jgi:hypothetical protein